MGNDQLTLRPFYNSHDTSFSSFCLFGSKNGIELPIGQSHFIQGQGFREIFRIKDPVFCMGPLFPILKTAETLFILSLELPSVNTIQITNGSTGKGFSIGRFFLRTQQNPESCGFLWQ